MEQELLNTPFVQPDVVLPCVSVEPIENDKFNRFYLKSIVGPEMLFSRLGEFMACLCGVDKFNFFKEDKVYEVEMTPIENGEVEENNTEDLGEDTNTDDSVENTF